MASSHARPPFDPAKVVRPDRKLLGYYAIVSLFAGPFYPLVFLPLYFKYETLRYRFDATGIAMSWGILFRKEITLTYRRIQDIHLTRNILQRWMGLATVSIQTASGGATPEATVEGILEAEPLRDYLYGKMRGAKDDAEEDDVPQAAAESAEIADGDKALALLCEIRDLLGRAAARERSQA